jgi:hypothetical protein
MGHKVQSSLLARIGTVGLSVSTNYVSVAIAAIRLGVHTPRPADPTKARSAHTKSAYGIQLADTARVFAPVSRVGRECGYKSVAQVI